MQKAKLSDNSRSLRLLRVRKEKSLGFKRKYYTKGISPLLATVLLIATTVVISTMLAGWVSSTTSATQNTITNKTTEGVACAAAEIVIDDVYAGAGSGSIARAIVRNSGGSDNLAITSAQLYDKFGNNFTTVNSLPTSLNKGQMATLSFNYTILPATTNDSAQGMNNGTLLNGTLWTLDGKYGGAMKFDGIQNFVNISHSTSLNVSGKGNITFEAWAKWAGGGCLYGGILTKRYDNSHLSYYLGMGQNSGTSDGDPSFGMMNSTGSWVADDFAYDSVPQNTWAHLAATYNGSIFISYVNGIQRNFSYANGSIFDYNVPLLIGALSPYSCFFNGTIDDVAIWNRSLTNAEINSSMNSGPLTVSNTNDLVGYWKFDEGKGILSCPSDFSRVVITTNCGGVSAEFTKQPKC